MNVPDSMFTKVMMIVPITSPFVAVPRVLLGDPSTGEIALSIGLLVVAAIGSMWLASRLYRVGVLMYGQVPSFKSLLKIGGMQSVSR
jgi:ABC-2 type transport system permease protein